MKAITAPNMRRAPGPRAPDVAAPAAAARAAPAWRAAGRKAKLKESSNG